MEVSKDDIKEFLRKMKHPKDVVYDDLEEALRKVSLLDLILNPKEHAEVAVKILVEGFVDKDIMVTKFEELTILLANDKITFPDNDIPFEGTGHVKALHITVQSEGYLIGSVLIDGGSALNIYSYETLLKVGISTMRIKSSSVVVRAFDGTHRDTIGEIELEMEIGPHVFMVNCQVLDTKSGYIFC